MSTGHGQPYYWVWRINRFLSPQGNCKSVKSAQCGNSYNEKIISTMLFNPCVYITSDLCYMRVCPPFVTFKLTKCSTWYYVLLLPECFTIRKFLRWSEKQKLRSKLLLIPCGLVYYTWNPRNPVGDAAPCWKAVVIFAVLFRNRF